MEDFYVLKTDDDDDGTNPIEWLTGYSHLRDKRNQIIVSLVLGVIAFLAFCVLRPRWSGLYAARKRQKNAASELPELPQSLFGWIIPLWRVTDQQILASAGLDAYVFLAFFKMAMKFLLITTFFSLIIIKPVHDANPPDDEDDHKNHNGTGNKPDGKNETILDFGRAGIYGNGSYHLPENFDTAYLWMYVFLAYFFSAIAVYLIISETKRIIAIRQEYLGTQTSVTDRTLKLSGIPLDLQDEDRIKEFIEALDIGKVESVTLCRKWKELDNAVAVRMEILRRLEEAHTTHTGRSRVERNLETLPVAQPQPPAPLSAVAEAEEQHDVSRPVPANGQPDTMLAERQRPKTTIRFGWMKLQSTKVDAIDYYEEKLRVADEKVREFRKQTFAPTQLAFITMDSVASCQMAIQAVLDPSPLQLIATQSPAPADIMWHNTYLPRRTRLIRSWSITVLIVFSTVFWFAILVPIAVSLNVKTIGKVWPQLKDILEEHKNIQSLVNTQLPTLLTSLLMVLIPYIYYWLSWYQGEISQGDVELSAISKNFFFTFFNFFVVFTVLGTASNFYEIFQHFGDALQDIRKVAFTLALSLQKFLDFYINFIILQGVGLFPFRLLEFGSVTLYPIYRMGSKTPRDYAELVQPPVFSYGFYLPTALLIFIICMVYSVMRSSWEILLAGLIFFSLGHFVYKYQLLYAMDHREQTTGRAWGMICDRLFVGLVFFQITMAGQLLLKQAVWRSVLMIPLIAATIWIAVLYGRTFKPLMRFIALRSVRRGEQYTDVETPPGRRSVAGSIFSADLASERNPWLENGSSRQDPQRDALSPSVSDGEELLSRTRMRFINPSLVAPLEGVWVQDKNFRGEDIDGETVVNGESPV